VDEIRAILVKEVCWILGEVRVWVIVGVNGAIFILIFVEVREFHLPYFRLDQVILIFLLIIFYFLSQTNFIISICVFITMIMMAVYFCSY
jgi:hypothetical protein